MINASAQPRRGSRLFVYVCTCNSWPSLPESSLTGVAKAAVRAAGAGGILLQRLAALLLEEGVVGDGAPAYEQQENQSFKSPSSLQADDSSVTQSLISRLAGVCVRAHVGVSPHLHERNPRHTA